VDLKSISDDMEKEFSRVPPLEISRLNKVDRTGLLPPSVESEE
jgi:hypothetical protein